MIENKVFQQNIKLVVFLRFIKYKHVWPFNTKSPDRDTKFLFLQNLSG